MINYETILFILAGAALTSGLIFGSYYNKIFTLLVKFKPNRNNEEKSNIKREWIEIDGEEKNHRSKPDIVKKNYQLLEDEIKIYKFEKDLVSHAIENILVASHNKTIDHFEKDRLLLKYNDQLKKLNKKMEKLQSEVDVTKLLDLRHDLVFLLENKIYDIDEKINEITLNLKNKSNALGINKQNNKKNNRLNNKSNDLNSFYDIEEIVDANLNSKNVINHTNSDRNKKRERVINAEREKIVNLKEQILTALSKLDKAENIKEEIENEIVVIERQNKREPINEENKSSLLEGQDIYTFKKNPNINESKESTDIQSIEKVSIPKIFNTSKNSQFDNITIRTNNTVGSPIQKKNNTTTQSISENNENLNKIQIHNSLNKNQYRSNNNYKKINNSNSNISSNSPLFNLTNSNSKIDFFNIKEYNGNKNKAYFNDEKLKKIKFPLRFIFSKHNKQEKISKNKDYHDSNTEKRRDSLSNLLK